MGFWYVPSASLVRPLPSGRTSQRSVSLPRMISSTLDQLGSPVGRVEIVFPNTSEATTACGPEYMTPVPSGDQPRNCAPATPSPTLFPVVTSITLSDWSCVNARCEPSGDSDMAVTAPMAGSEGSVTGPAAPYVYPPPPQPPRPPPAEPDSVSSRDVHPPQRLVWRDRTVRAARRQRFAGDRADGWEGGQLARAVCALRVDGPVKLTSLPAIGAVTAM